MRDGGDAEHVFYTRLVNDLAIYGIGLAKREASGPQPRLTTQDRRFLESLRIQVDQDSMEEERDRRIASRLTMTPQDVRFLKSLRIAVDDLE